MTTMTAREESVTRPAVPRADSTGIIIAPDRLKWYREDRSWSRQELADIVTGLGWIDDNGDPVELTRDAIAKFETEEGPNRRNPRPVVLRALAEALSGELVAEYDEDTGAYLDKRWVPCADESCRVTPRQLRPSPDRLPPHADAVAREARREHLRELRRFAEEHCIPFRNPDTGRIYYSRGLHEAFTAATSEAPEPVVAAAVQHARDTALPSRAHEDKAGQLLALLTDWSGAMCTTLKGCDYHRPNWTRTGADQGRARPRAGPGGSARDRAGRP